MVNICEYTMYQHSPRIVQHAKYCPHSAFLNWNKFNGQVRQTDWQLIVKNKSFIYFSDAFYKKTAPMISLCKHQSVKCTVIKYYKNLFFNHPNYSSTNTSFQGAITFTLDVSLSHRPTFITKSIVFCKIWNLFHEKCISSNGTRTHNVCNIVLCPRRYTLAPQGDGELG